MVLGSMVVLELFHGGQDVIVDVVQHVQQLVSSGITEFLQKMLVIQAIRCLDIASIPQ
jgi:hypothetical protein